MIITCPHCQTKYQVTYEAIGSAGRKVQCAHCRQAWQQRPLEPDEPSPEQKAAFDAMAEDGLDEAMLAEARLVAEEAVQKLVAEPAPTEATRKSDAAIINKRQKDFTRRQSAMVADLPLARLRRTMRVAGVLALVGLACIGYFGRVGVVERYPDLAGLYAAVGLGVNVVGLEFTNVTTLRSLRDGKEVLAVSAQIVGIEPKPVSVPAVVVTLLDDQGSPIYEWSVTPAVRDLMAGERSTFDTQLTTPPGNAARVRLSFAGGTSIHTAPAPRGGTPDNFPE
jgi:predicted Zn finger-like uncharacterized protein